MGGIDWALQAANKQDVALRIAAGGQIIRVSALGKGNCATVQAACDLAAAGDTILIDATGTYSAGHAQQYLESVTMTDKDNILIIGIGGEGMVRINGAAAGGTAMTLTGCRDITFENIKFAGNTTGNGAKMIGTGDTRRIRFVKCWFTASAGGNGAAFDSVNAQVADVVFENCVFTNLEYGLYFNSTGSGNPVGQIFVRNCEFYNFKVSAISCIQWVNSIMIEGCKFGFEEDGTLPSAAIIHLDETSTTGHIYGCYFPLAAHDSTNILIASTVGYSGNFAEEGVNVTRPN